MFMFAELLFYSLLGGVFSLIGGLVLLWRSDLAHRMMTTLISIGAGAFLGAALLDMIPEALEQTEDWSPIMVAVVYEYSIFFILERFLMRYFKGHLGAQSHSDHTESLPFLLILGDSLHNFLDGIIIAIAYTANPVLGLPTALAIAAHGIPQEIGDFSILLKLGWPKMKILAVNILQSLLTIPGVFIGYYLGQFIEGYVPLFLGGAAGTFIYIAASNIIPELHHQSGHKYFFRIVAPLVASIVVIFFLVKFAHGE